MNTMKKIIGFALLFSALTSLQAQDLHYADVQQMGQWYNQSLRRSRDGEIQVNWRDIAYQNTFAFRTGTLLLNLTSGTKKEIPKDAEKGYFSFSLGAAFDETNNGFYKGTTGLMGVAYAQPLNRNGLYASVGFQGTLTTNKYGSTGTFPDQFDQYGPITGAVSADPLRAGNKYSFFSFNAGATIFQTGSSVDWYVGGSIRHLNKPYTEVNKLDDFRLNATSGLQAGFTLRGDRSSFSGYGVGNWKGNASEILAGAQYLLVVGGDGKTNGTKKQGEEKDVSISLGCAVRIKDALIPAVGLNYNKTRVALHYDMNNSSIRTSGFARRGFELALTQKF